MVLPQSKEVDVLFWANINPNKRGSFEDYLCQLSSLCQENGVKLKFVLGDKINDLLRTFFNKYSVNYFTLSSKKFGSIWTMIGVLKNFKPKIIHLNFIGFAGPLILLCKMMGVGKVILTDHTSTPVANRNLYRGGIWGGLKRLRNRFYVRQIDHFIGVSNFIGNRLQICNRIPAKKVSVIYNGVDLDRFRPPKDELEKAQWKEKLFDVDQSVSVVTFIGQLTEEKGLVVYLGAIKKLLQTRDDIVFVFAGSGPLEGHLVHWSEQAKNKRVRFLGLRDDVELILRASDIVVVPSVWEEAFGLINAEASASGVPVIGSRIGGIPEVILDQKTGILVTPGDVEELAIAIEKLVYDNKLRLSFSDQGRKHVEKYFDLKIQVYETVKLYRNFLNR